jgi:uncharacterized protein (DUF486 family)
MDFHALSRPVGISATIGLLLTSNLFMTFAWYWHLKKTPSGEQGIGALFGMVLASWGLAFFEYSIMVPANRLGSAMGLSVPQLKIIQEVITVCVFLPFVMFYMGEKWRWDYLWAMMCMVGAVYFVNRGSL